MPLKVCILDKLAELCAHFAAVVSLHGRYFGGRRIRACFYDPERYERNELID